MPTDPTFVDDNGDIVVIARDTPISHARLTKDRFDRHGSYRIEVACGVFGAEFTLRYDTREKADAAFRILSNLIREQERA